MDLERVGPDISNREFFDPLFRDEELPKVHARRLHFAEGCDPRDRVRQVHTPATRREQEGRSQCAIGEPAAAGSANPRFETPGRGKHST